MDISLPSLPNADSNRWGFVRGADGDVQFDDTEAHAVVTSVLEDKGGYWADPKHGSELGQLKNLTSRTPSQAEAMTLDALAALEQANDIVSPTASATSPRGANQLRDDVAWKTPNGEDHNRTVSL